MLHRLRSRRRRGRMTTARFWRAILYDPSLFKKNKTYRSGVFWVPNFSDPFSYSAISLPAFRCHANCHAIHRNHRNIKEWQSRYPSRYRNATKGKP